jgi:XTP/dITP diphosphohydrolase
MRMVVASRNSHKLRELSQLLESHDLVPLPDGVALPPEDGDTFAENALGKARAAARETGESALGEDSGIEVAALGGGPGVRSARYAGESATDEENLRKLLAETEGADDRRAAYVSAIALVEPNGDEELFIGRCEGRLVDEPRGSGGFGYDPIFVPDAGGGGDRTMAELAPELKNAISHRGVAARALRDWLKGRS